MPRVAAYSTEMLEDAQLDIWSPKVEWRACCSSGLPLDLRTAACAGDVGTTRAGMVGLVLSREDSARLEAVEARASTCAGCRQRREQASDSGSSGRDRFDNKRATTDGEGSSKHSTGKVLQRR